ncbi:MAG: pyrroline-5-carboxylate reductase [Pseudomonadota bacterium]|jgi:pyrroline-5-carboxylate reductase
MAIDLKGPLVLVGAGNMGGAMLTGWLAEGLDPKLVRVQDPSPPAAIAALLAQHGIEAEAELELDRPPAVMLMAVKPQIMDQVFPSAAKLAGAGTVVLSVAAGKTIASFERHLPKGSAVVRTIPNTPASVGRGITGAYANPATTSAQKALCQKLLEAIGQVVWVEREDLIDAVTAVSGSGPAYVFHMVEAMTAAGIAAGLPADTAAALARATVSGAGEMLHRSTLDPATLRRNVTSPNGTTYAALEVLMGPMLDGEKKLERLMTDAIAAATRRSRELAG